MAAAARGRERERERGIARLTRTCAQDQRTLLNVVHLEAIVGLLLDRHREFQAPVEKDLEQEVFACAVRFHAADNVEQGCLHELVSGDGRVGQVRCIHTERSEPNINPVLENAGVALELDARATDALSADLGDHAVPILCCRGILAHHFIELNRLCAF